MPTNDWKKIKSKNQYITHRWMNKKKGLLLEIHYDIGFGKQRNATVYNYKNQLLSGYEEVVTHYGKDEKDALQFSKSYMRNH